jgi:hypothetical protein
MVIRRTGAERSKIISKEKGEYLLSQTKQSIDISLRSSNRAEALFGHWPIKNHQNWSPYICEHGMRQASRKTRVAHRRMKIERVYRPYLTATEAAP